MTTATPIRATPQGSRFFSVTVTNQGRRSLVWSPAFATAREAKAHGKQRVDNGAATVAFVVVVEPDGTKDIADSFTYPKSAQRIIGHYLDLVDAIEGPEETQT